MVLGRWGRSGTVSIDALGLQRDYADVARRYFRCSFITLEGKLMSLGRRLAVMAALFANYPGRMAVEAAELWYYNTYWPDP